MSAVERFAYEGRVVRTVTVDGDPWFVAADVCAVLGLRNTSEAVRGLDVDERGIRTADTPSGLQEMVVVSEAGLYSLLVRSRRIEAKPFRRWVTHEVLPAIRRTGSYGAGPGLPDLTTSAGVVAMAEQLLTTARQLQAAEQRVAELEPQAAAANVLLDASGAMSVGAFANMVGIGRTTLFKILYAEQILQRDRRPYQTWATAFRVVATPRELPNGHTVLDHTSYVLPGGALRLYKLLARRGYPVRRPDLGGDLVAVPGAG